jgi:zinc protease
MVLDAPETYETSLAVAQQHAELVSCGIDESFIDQHLDALHRLDGVRWEHDVRSLIDPDRMHVAVAGRFDPRRSAVAALQRGTERCP